MTFLSGLPSGTRTPTPEDVIRDMMESAGDDADLRERVREAAVAVYGPEVVEASTRILYR